MSRRRVNSSVYLQRSTILGRSPTLFGPRRRHLVAPLKLWPHYWLAFWRTAAFEALYSVVQTAVTRLRRRDQRRYSKCAMVKWNSTNSTLKILVSKLSLWKRWRDRSEERRVGKE